jgi:transposase
MSSLIKKSINGKEYYYIVDCKRISGKPKIVNQIYLGSVENVLEKLKESKGAVSPIYSDVLDFGAISALYEIACSVDLVKRIDKIAKKRNQGISIGNYLLIAAINRAVNPISKSNLEQWYQKTILSRLLPTNKKQLLSQRFWDNMDCWTDENIQKFEEEFIPFLIKEYKISTKCLIYDATNFFTYIDTENTKADIAQRGHCKAKRNDLRIIGLSLMLSADSEIPLFYEVYEGNESDSRQFAKVISKLKTRYINVFKQEPDITLVFDRGNNSKDNIESLESNDTTFHFVGGLKRNQCKELYNIPKSQYENVEGEEFGTTTAYKTKTQVYNKDMTVVIVHNTELLRGQLQGIIKNREKCRNKLKEYQGNLLSWANGLKKKGKKPTFESCKSKIKEILSSEYMEELFIVEWNEINNIPVFDFQMPETLLLQLEERELGKNVLFTDHHDWSSEKIISAYRSAWKIESTFRQMKDTDHISVRPIWHWTTQKIKVHIFYCVIAYRLCSILKKRLKENGISMSVDKILDSLSEKKQLIHYYSNSKGLRENYSMTKCDDQTEKIIDVLGLGKYQIKLR